MLSYPIAARVHFEEVLGPGERRFGFPVNAQALERRLLERLLADDEERFWQRVAELTLQLRAKGEAE